jgi:hypothetical protein
MKYEVIRDVTPTECTWLPRVIKKGEVFKKFEGATYGVVTNAGVAVLYNCSTALEIPKSAVKIIY